MKQAHGKPDKEAGGVEETKLDESWDEVNP